MAEFSSQDEFFMRAAIDLAREAACGNEVPVGAVLVKENNIIARAANSPISSCDPCAHAEVNVLRQAGAALQNYRLVDTTLYVTLEPCLMCVGALVHARVGRLVYGAADVRVGAVESSFQVLQSGKLNHRLMFVGGLLANECGLLLTEFFQVRRSKNKTPTSHIGGVSNTEY